ncbi:CoF synthetase [Priestia endophytica]|uniref:LuxE/PaaK family acyltransferase n=1 Tax=Priestia endophytica TaxID=135735 RepID=UPI00227FDD99|nr:CoF synthetase [Priestia endophytica]MCY8232495.1 CoF synthetase [Priestia endophytica]
MREDSKMITYEILQFIEGNAQEKQTNPDIIDATYNELALKLFQYQFKHNKAYKKFCQVRKRTPLTVKKWIDIPPMPIQGYKELTLSCEPIEEAEAVFMTSGTTNPEAKGKNYHPDLTIWDASMKGPFKQFVMPDYEKMTIFILSPAEDLNQNSSLSRYLSNAVSYFGTENSEFFFSEEGLNFERLVSQLKRCEEKREPVMLMGASFAYVHILDYLKEKQIQFQLPEKSRIFDTGGFKGQSREVDMEQLYTEFQTYFQIGRDKCINMYGMTELSSQIYNQTILSSYLNRSVIHDKAAAPWIKTVILNTETLEPVQQGEKGVIAHYDLANWNSCLALLTEDLGYQTKNGFVLLGRIKDSEARGCSIAVDQLIQSNSGGAVR